MGSNDLPDMAIRRCYDHPRPFECPAAERGRRNRHNHKGTRNPGAAHSEVRISPRISLRSRVGKHSVRAPRRRRVP